MKKVKTRALTALLLVGAVIAGLGFYIGKYTINGGEWAAFASNAAAYNSGAVPLGTLTDRNGVVLAGVTDGKRTYAQSAETRRAMLHVTGDTSGNISTGALSLFASKLAGYNIVTGTYSRTGGGESVALSIDEKLCLAAYNAMGDRKGAVVVMNYETGEILCMVSTPAYDPQEMPKIEEGDPKYEGVYLNRVISAAYTPGSTFKLITAAAALERLDGIDDRVFECEGSLRVGESSVTCKSAHGKLTLEDALAVSCNTAFAQLALELGAETLGEYFEKYGFAQPGSFSGIKTAKSSYEPAQSDTIELAWSGVGQAGNIVCPAAMLRFTGAIANEGEAAEMTLLKRSGVTALKPASGNRIIKKETAERLSAMMNYNVIHTYGADNYPGLELYAKSGTAEVGGGLEPHAWFTGFIKNEGHPLAFVVVVENGGSGNAVAGNVANKVLQTYFS